MKPTGPISSETRQVIATLNKTAASQKKAVWKTLAIALQKPRRNRPQVNVQKIERLSAKFAKKILVIPGKILAGGQITKPVHVAALEYSQTAKQKIKNAKGTAMTLSELAAAKPKAAEIILIK